MKKMLLQKIPLEALLEVLNDLYLNGADYVDITGIPGTNQDSITVSAKKEYFDSESSYDDFSERIISEGLSEDDLLKLTGV